MSNLNNKHVINNRVFGIPDVMKANCYVFALAPQFRIGGYHKNRAYKARPGDKCEKWKNTSFDFNDCAKFIQRIVCDNRQLVKEIPEENYKTVYNNPVERGHHLMAAVLSPGTHTDFHFLRRVPVKSIINKWDYFKRQMQRNNKNHVIQKFLNVVNNTNTRYLWIHQRGWSRGGPIIYDAKDNLIFNPKKGNYDYGGLNYNKFCGIFDVVSRKATVTTQHDS